MKKTLGTIVGLLLIASAHAQSITFGSGVGALGALTSNDLVCGAGSSIIQDCANVSTFVNLTKPFNLSYTQPTSTSVNQGVFQVQRTANYTGGPVGDLNAIFAVTTVGQNVTNFEWAILGQVNNSAAGGQNVAVDGTAFKEITAYQVGPTWGGNFVCQDLNAAPNPTASCIGAELDNYVSTGAGTDTGKQRVGLQIAWGHAGAGSPSSGDHIGLGILMGSHDATVMDRAISMAGSGGYGIGVDFTQATFSIAPIYLAAGQQIVFDGNSTGAFNRDLFFTTGVLVYHTQNGNIFQVTDAGALALSSTAQASSFIAYSAAPTVAGNQIGYGGTVVASSNCGSLASSAGCILINVAGTSRYLPYY
jgi:hypothetical protein